MSYVIRFIFAFILVQLATVQAGQLIPFTAELEAIRHGAIDLSTNGSLSLRPASDGLWHYRLETDGRTVALREEVWFTMEEDTVTPQRYEFESRVFWSKTHKRLNFDHNLNKVSGVVNDDKISTSFEPPLYDAIGYQIALQQRLADGERDISFDVLRHKRVDRMAFRVIGEERLSLPAGDVYTWIIEQTEPIGRDERKLIWVAPELNYIPLRFGRYEKGKLKEEIRTLSLKQNGKSINFGN